MNIALFASLFGAESDAMIWSADWPVVEAQYVVGLPAHMPVLSIHHQYRMAKGSIIHTEIAQA